MSAEVNYSLYLFSYCCVVNLCISYLRTHSVRKTMSRWHAVMKLKHMQSLSQHTSAAQDKSSRSTRVINQIVMSDCCSCFSHISSLLAPWLSLHTTDYCNSLSLSLSVCWSVSRSSLSLSLITPLLLLLSGFFLFILPHHHFCVHVKRWSNSIPLCVCDMCVGFTACLDGTFRSRWIYKRWRSKTGVVYHVYLRTSVPVSPWSRCWDLWFL